MIKFSCLFVLFAMLRQPGLAGDVRVELVAMHGQREVPFDALSLQNEAGQAFSITRLDLHLSEIALQRSDGAWTALNGWAAYLSLRDRINGFTLTGVPEGKYKALRFHVGLPAKLNAADATKFPAGHPLNPTVTSLWWGWQGGYVFLAMEGRWRAGGGPWHGYSYHVAMDENLMSVEVPCSVDLSTSAAVKIPLDTAKILKGITFSAEATSTHSRQGDELAKCLKSNIEASFATGEATHEPPTAPTAAKRPQGPLPGETLKDFSFPPTFPMPQLPGDNPLTLETIALGKQLFHDKRLSRGETLACSSCHDEARAFSDARAFSTGVGGQPTKRHAMPLFNLAWKSRFFWDGRAGSLREQVLEPLQNPLEMGETLENIEKKTGLTRTRIALALEQYLLTLLSPESKFDRVMRGQETFSTAEQRGFELFHTEYDPGRNQRGADCFHCHGGPLFQSVPFANNGLDSQFTDEGRFLATQRPGDKGKFATPSLRNIAQTAPYMHDGRFATLEQVMEHYDHGIQRSETLDPNLAKHPAAGLGLSGADKAALMAFLRCL